MKDIIKIDFNVEVISEQEEQSLFFNVDNLFYTLVWLDERDSFNRIEQIHLLRYELSNNLKSHIDSNTSDNTFVLASGEEVSFVGGQEQVEIEIKTHFSDTVFHISSNTELIENLQKDLVTLELAREGLSSTTKDEILSGLIGCLPNQEVRNEVVSEDLQIILFEKALSKSGPCYALSDIYKILLSQDFSDTERLNSSLMEGFDLVYDTDCCDCGNEGCFFEILKENQLYFFHKSYRDKEGEFDSDKVKRDFDLLWNALSTRKKASLRFLYNEFYNTTLLNLSFVKPNFNLTRYQFLMCYPYQPDSEEEKMVRKVSTLANFLIQSEK